MRCGVSTLYFRRAADYSARHAEDTDHYYHQDDPPVRDVEGVCDLKPATLTNVPPRRGTAIS